MAMQISNNISAITIMNWLNTNNKELSKALKKATSGMKYNSAGDDTSAYNISEKMRVQIRGLEACGRNILSGKSLLNVALGGLEQIKNSLEEMSSLSMQAANDTLTDSDRNAVQKVFDQYRQNIDDIAVGTNFNGITPLHPLGEKPDKLPHIVPKTTPPSSTNIPSINNKVDVVFLVDTTNSMRLPINQVATNMQTFVNKLSAANLDYRLAVVSFNEETNISAAFREPAALELDFTDSYTTVARKLTGIASEVGTLTGRGSGGDDPESGLEGIQAAINLPSWRSDATKQIISISDAEFHDSTDIWGTRYLNVNDIIDQLKISNIHLSAVTTIGTKAATEWGWITSATNGKLVNISGNYGNNLSHIASSIAE